MLQSSKLLLPPCSEQPSFKLPLARLIHRQQKIAPCSPALEHPGILSRRALAIQGSSPLLLFLASQALDPFGLPNAKAAEDEEIEATVPSTEQQGNVQENTNVKAAAEEEAEAIASVTEGQGNEQENSNVKAAAEEEEEAEAIASVTEGQGNEQENSNVKVAEEAEAIASVTKQQGNVDENLTSCTDKIPTKCAFIDISIDGQPQGRVVIGLYEKNVPTGAARFSNLVSGSAGVSYRRKEFIKIMPNYIQHGGVRSYGVDAEMAMKTGSSLGSESLAQEWERQEMTCPGTKMLAGSVGLVVRNPLKPPPKMKLVARRGKLEIDQEEVGSDPNGTEFVIASKDSPELDASVLVVGRVLEGMDVVEKIEQVKRVQENTSSPYFRVAKLIGDKRAVVAERGFNRPYSKVVVTNCGLIQ